MRKRKPYRRPLILAMEPDMNNFLHGVQRYYQGNIRYWYTIKSAYKAMTDAKATGILHITRYKYERTRNGFMWNGGYTYTPVREYIVFNSGVPYASCSNEVSATEICKRNDKDGL